MNNQIRRLALLIFCFFVVLMGASTYIQGIGASGLNADSRNTRAVYRVKFIDRGAIYAGNEKLAYSEPVKNHNRYRPEYIRKYSPDLEAFEHLVGVLNNRVPPFGIENAEKSVLMGEGSENLWQQAKDYFTGSPQRGSSIRLTINPTMQKVAWEQLAGYQGAAVVINYKTGAILAAASRPSFNPAPFIDQNASKENPGKLYAELQKDPHRPLLNRAFSDNFPPGSTFKLLTVSAMMKANSDLTPETKVDAPLYYSAPGTTSRIYNYGRFPCGNGTPTLKHALGQSCNPPFAKAAVELGYDKMLETVQAYGFNGKPAIQVPLPVVNSYFPDKDPGKPSLAQSAIGQFNVRATPLQMAMVAGSIANNGKRVKPFLIQDILSAHNKVLKTNQGGEVLSEPITPEIATKLQSLMYSNIEFYRILPRTINGFKLAGKTGTAEILTTPGKSVNDGWFVGFIDSAKYPYAFAIMIEGDREGTGLKRAPTGLLDCAPMAVKILQVGTK